MKKLRSKIWKFSLVLAITGLLFFLSSLIMGVKNTKIFVNKDGFHLQTNEILTTSAFNLESFENIEDVKEGRVNILGSVTRIKEVTTKKDSKMFFITVKDETGSISVTVFPSFYETFKDIKIGMVLLITGKAEVRNNELQLVLDDYKQI